jgi:hypothetical protein
MSCAPEESEELPKALAPPDDVAAAETLPLSDPPPDPEAAPLDPPSPN